MSKKKKHRLLDVGAGGVVKLPPDALEAIALEDGEKVRIVVDTRRKEIRLERHVEDVWAEALKPKEQKGFSDLIDEQAKRDEDAKKIFERKLKEAKPGERRPEDDPDLWR
ncbi:MAG: hypothetical protein OER88_01185 [Planctomycetota bacterium]|nr:hypothetical protein [Planctomycetota bacterium]